ncbi:MAG: hypothetical protein ACFE9S_15945 [Candidatus Hermodarchaeota archaeon]
MPCIHGLEELTCPTCRILKSTVPLKGIDLQKSTIPSISNSFSRKNINLEKQLINEISLKNKSPQPPSLISKPRFINEIPNFGNKLFLERTKELDITKEDNYAITKKIPLENPEWQFEEEE